MTKRSYRKKNTGRKAVAVMGLTALLAAAALGIYAYFMDQNGGENPKDTPLSTPVPEREDTGFLVAGPDNYDSADTCLLVEQDEEENTMTFLNLELGRRYTLSVDGTTRFMDKYGDGLSKEPVEHHIPEDPEASDDLAAIHPVLDLHRGRAL